MKPALAKLNSSQIISIAVQIVLSLSLAESVFGQARSRSRTTRDTEAAARERQRYVQNRSMTMQHIGDEAKLKGEQASLFARIREDFTRLQVLNNDMMQAASEAESLDYKLIAESTEEINKCAKRLKTNLAVPNAEKEKVQNGAALDDHHVKGLLKKLDSSIMSFVTSLGVVNTQDVNKVSRDLTDIIEMSNHIRKAAQKLDKASQASR